MADIGVSDASFDDFQAANEAADNRPDALQDYVLGTPHAPLDPGEQVRQAQGIYTPHPEEQFTDPTQGLMNDDRGAPAGGVPTPPDASPEAMPPPEQDWKRLYGQSENEKGELRKKVKDFLDKYSAAAPPPVGWPNVQPQAPVAPQAPGVPANFNPSPQPPNYQWKPGDQVVDGEDMQTFYSQVVQPQLHQQQMAYNQMQEQMALLQFENQKRSLGITPELENELRNENPALAYIQDPSTYLSQLMHARQMKEMREEASRIMEPPPAPTASTPIPDGTRQAMRVRTFVEPSQTQAQAPAPNLTPRQQLQLKIQEIMEKYPNPEDADKRAREMKAALASSGAPDVSGYRNPQVLTR